MKHVRLLEESLPRFGVHSEVLVGTVDSDEGDATASLVSAGIALRRVPFLGRKVRPWRDARALRWLLRTFREERPDVVHTHTGKAGLLGRLAARLASVPAIVHTHHGHLFHGYYGRHRSRLLLVLERTLARRTDLILVPGAPLRDELLALGVGSPDRVVAYPPGLDSTGFPAPAGTRGALRRRLGVPNDEVLFGTLGRLVHVKGFDRLVRAAGKASLSLAIAGRGPERAVLEREIRRLGPAGRRVHLVGETADASGFLSALDVFALGSHNEGLPAALLEAMACGLPCVAPAVGSIPEVIEHEVNGILYDAHDDEALLQSLVRLQQDASLRSRLGREAALSVRRQADPVAMAAVIAEAYRRVLGARRAEARSRP